MIERCALRQRVAILFAACGAGILALACGVTFHSDPTASPVTPADVIGTWTLAVYNEETSTRRYDVEMALSANNTFVQTIRIANHGDTLTQTGRWHLSGVQVRLENALVENHFAPLTKRSFTPGNLTWFMADSEVPNQPLGLCGGLDNDSGSYHEFAKINTGSVPVSPRVLNTAH